MVGQEAHGGARATKRNSRGGDRADSEESRMCRKEAMERRERERPRRQGRREEDSERNTYDIRFVQQPGLSPPTPTPTDACIPPDLLPGKQLPPQKVDVQTSHINVPVPGPGRRGGRPNATHPHTGELACRQQPVHPHGVSVSVQNCVSVRAPECVRAHSEVAGAAGEGAEVAGRRGSPYGFGVASTLRHSREAPSPAVCGAIRG